MSSINPNSLDLSEDEADIEEDTPVLGGGLKNYITQTGYDTLLEERRHLQSKERPGVVQTVSWAASNGDRSENGDYIYGKKRLRQIDGRIRFLNKRLKVAHVIKPEDQKNHDQIFFGAKVTYVREDTGEQKTITIVGVDEADTTLHKVSWVSPIAKAFLKAYEGDYAKIRTPSGLVPVEIISISYKP